MSTFELWDTESGNLLAVYPSQDAAVAFVGTVIAEYSDAAVEHWELFSMVDGTRAESVAYGEQLADLARGLNPTTA